MSDIKGIWFQLGEKEKFELASEKFFRYYQLRHYGKCKKWSKRLTHMAYVICPELREVGSLERYFVAKLGRHQGYRGVELTAFVDRAYETGLAIIAIDAGLSQGINA